MFPRKFVKPYSAPKSVGDDFSLIQNLNPPNCEWFGRPNMAFWFLSDTGQQCLPILKNSSNVVFEQEMVSSVNNYLEPCDDNFNRVNNVNEDCTSTQQDVYDVMSNFVEEYDHFDAVLDEFHFSRNNFPFMNPRI